jgi:hypothetical protein
MTTRLNIKTKPLRDKTLSKYSNEFGKPIRIVAHIAYFSIREEGFVPRGIKKDRFDLGELVDSITIRSDSESLNIEKVYGVIGFREEKWKPLVEYEDLHKMAMHCKMEQLEVEEAFEYIKDKIIEQVGTNEERLIQEKGFGGYFIGGKMVQ